MSPQRVTTINFRNALYEDALDIMRAEPATVTLDVLASRLAVSRRQLQRVFQEVGDTTFRNALTRVRMERAGEELERRPMGIRELATALGYNQPAHFAKAFRRHHGVLPTEFRAGARSGAPVPEPAAR